jgi:hypothetical protein
MHVSYSFNNQSLSLLQVATRLDGGHDSFALAFQTRSLILLRGEKHAVLKFVQDLKLLLLNLDANRAV